MNKRIILLFFAFICVICCTFGLSACSKDAHTHLYAESVVTPTCTKQGYILHICSCGDSYKDSYIDALGHDLVHHDEPARKSVGANTTPAPVAIIRLLKRFRLCYTLPQRR